MIPVVVPFRMVVPPEVVVGVDYTDLAEALDNVAPGTTIVLDGGVHQLPNVTTDVGLRCDNGADLVATTLAETDGLAAWILDGRGGRRR